MHISEYKNLILDSHIPLLSQRKLIREELMDIWLLYEQMKKCTLASDVLQMHRNAFYMRTRQTAVGGKKSHKDSDAFFAVNMVL